MKGKRVLVTGAGGFIGSHLTERLVAEGAQVTALVHYNSRGDCGLLKYIPKSVFEQVNIIFGDVQDEYFMEKTCRRQDIVFHLAALIGIPYSYVAPESYIHTNIQGTLNVLKSSMRGNVKRVVHTSTSEAYGTARYTPIDEKHSLQGQSPYSASKIAADKLAESFHLSFGLPVVTIRPFNTFGPRQSLRAVVPTIIAQSLAGTCIKLGALKPVRDMNYIANTIDGFILCATESSIEGKVFNVGYGKGWSIAELIEKIGVILGKKLEVESEEERIRPDKSEVMELVCNYDKARKMLGYKPKVTLNEGLKVAIEFIKEHSDIYCGNHYVL
jgi:NAD dependent epimerase/dehydratase